MKSEDLTPSSPSSVVVGPSFSKPDIKKCCERTEHRATNPLRRFAHCRVIIRKIIPWQTLHSIITLSTAKMSCDGIIDFRKSKNRFLSTANFLSHCYIFIAKKSGLALQLKSIDARLIRRTSKMGPQQRKGFPGILRPISQTIRSRKIPVYYSHVFFPVFIS